MKFSILAAFGALSSVSTALPAAVNIEDSVSDANSTLVVRNSPGDRCGNSIFVDKTSGGSPRLFDCAAIVYQLRLNRPNQDIYFDLPEANGPILKAVDYGSCAFGVRRSYVGSGTAPAVVGTNDIADLIDSSIQKFGPNDQVGAEGAMVCASGAGVWWGIYRNC